MDNSAVRKSALAGPSAEPSQKTPQPWPQPRLPLAPSSSAPRGGGGHKRGAVATITEWCPGARSGSSEPCCANRDRIRKSREKRAGELLLELKIVDLTHPPSLLMYDAMSDCCSCWVLASSTSRRSWSIRPARPAPGQLRHAVLAGCGADSGHLRLLTASLISLRRGMLLRMFCVSSSNCCITCSRAASTCDSILSAHSSGLL